MTAREILWGIAGAAVLYVVLERRRSSRSGDDAAAGGGDHDDEGDDDGPDSEDKPCCAQCARAGIAVGETYGRGGCGAGAVLTGGTTGPTRPVSVPVILTAPPPVATRPTVLTAPPPRPRPGVLTAPPPRDHRDSAGGFTGAIRLLSRSGHTISTRRVA